MPFLSRETNQGEEPQQQEECRQSAGALPRLARDERGFGTNAIRRDSVPESLIRLTNASRTGPLVGRTV